MNPLKIMLVEDSEVTQATLSQLLGELELEVVNCLTAEDALEKLQGGPVVDLIILDFRLPGMSGPKFYRKLKLQENLKGIPVVTFSSRWNSQMKTKESQEWVAAFLALDFSPDTPGSNTYEVAKEGGEDVSASPEKLLFVVAKALKENKKVLPAKFEEFVRQLEKI